MKPRCIIIIITLFFSSCSLFNNSSKYSFNDGYYRSTLNDGKKKKYYLATKGDSIKVYPGDIAARPADTIHSVDIAFPPVGRPSQFSNYTFTTHAFDIDFVSILFKYRPPVGDFPIQLNANFNGAVYGGYRIDKYRLSYQTTPLHVQQRSITHTGYSVGGFAGIGMARIDEYVTLNRINYQYDGVVFNTGIAGEFALNKINFGIAFGLDFLLDKNRHVWIN